MTTDKSGPPQISNTPASSPGMPIVVAKADSQFLLSRFIDKLDKNVHKNGILSTVGYAAFAVDGYGQTASKSGGFAKSKLLAKSPDMLDVPAEAMSVDHAINIASASKPITAAAVLKLLHENKIGLNWPVYPFLPGSWKLGKGWDEVTFHELLTHHSGISSDSFGTLEELQVCVAQDLPPNPTRLLASSLANSIDIRFVDLRDKHHNYVWQYLNNNFAFFRLLIPQILAANLGTGYPTARSAIDFKADEYAENYRQYVQKNVFDPIYPGKTISLKPLTTNAALGYDAPTPSDSDFQKGTNFGDFTLKAGYAGWQLSARQLAIFADALLNTDKILAQRIVNDDMRKFRRGLYVSAIAERIRENFSSVLTVDGKADALRAYEHAGTIPAKGNGGEVNTYLGGFNNGISVGMIINSQLDGVSVPKMYLYVWKSMLEAMGAVTFININK